MQKVIEMFQLIKVRYWPM